MGELTVRGNFTASFEIELDLDVERQVLDVLANDLGPGINIVDIELDEVEA
jgi:hypothetical protein